MIRMYKPYIKLIPVVGDCFDEMGSDICLIPNEVTLKKLQELENSEADCIAFYLEKGSNLIISEFMFVRESGFSGECSLIKAGSSCIDISLAMPDEIAYHFIPISN